MHTSLNRCSRATLFLGFAAAVLASLAFSWPWKSAQIWPKTSVIPAATLDHPTIEEKLRAIDRDVSSGYRFFVYGDQRPLADGEWQELTAHMGLLKAADDRILFVLDTGDIVGDGSYSDQFVMLREILRPIRDLPYLVAVGNHELESNRPCPARANTATFLSYLDPEFSVGKMYYRKDIGPVRFLFLDTTDLVKGDAGGLESPTGPVSGSRAEAQMNWLVRQLSEEEEGSDVTTVVAIHNPIIQSSRKHRDEAIVMWEYEHRGRRFPDILADGGVDVVLTGNTHTYERFLLRRSDGRQFRLINLSGRPRTSLFYWLSDLRRRPEGIRGREREWFRKRGWTELEQWEIIQEEVMAEDPHDQFAVFTVDDAGGLMMDLFFLDDAPRGLRQAPPVRVK